MGIADSIKSPWWSPSYARAANASNKTGLELEQDRLQGASAYANDPVKQFALTGTVGSIPKPPAAPGVPGMPAAQASTTPGLQDSISRRALAGQPATSPDPVRDSISRRALAEQPAKAPGLTVQPWANPTGAQDSISRRALSETSQPGVFKATAPSLGSLYTNTPEQSAQSMGLTVQPGAAQASQPTSIRQMAMRDAQQSVQPQDNQPEPANSIYRAAMQGATSQPMNDTQMSIASVARANQARQQQVDMQQPGGAAVLADPNDAANAEKTARWREDELIKKAQYNPQLASIAGQAIQGNAARDIEAAKQPGIASNLALQARGQDINRELQAGQQSISSRALEMNNARDNERLGLDRSRFGLDQERFGLEKDEAKRKAAMGNADWRLQVTPTTKNPDGSTSMGSIYRYNQRTGQTERIDGGVAPQPPKVGTIQDGYRYNGGNPADMHSWSKV